MNGALARTPSLMVPRGARIWNNGIVMAVDAPRQDRQIIAVAVNIALQWHLPLHLVIVITDETLQAELECGHFSLPCHSCLGLCHASIWIFQDAMPVNPKYDMKG